MALAFPALRPEFSSSSFERWSARRSPPRRPVSSNGGPSLCVTYKLHRRRIFRVAVFIYELYTRTAFVLFCTFVVPAPPKPPASASTARRQPMVSPSAVEEANSLFDGFAAVLDHALTQVPGSDQTGGGQSAADDGVHPTFQAVISLLVGHSPKTVMTSTSTREIQLCPYCHTTPLAASPAIGA